MAASSADSAASTAASAASSSASRRCVRTCVFERPLSRRRHQARLANHAFLHRVHLELPRSCSAMAQQERRAAGMTHRVL